MNAGGPPLFPLGCYVELDCHAADKDTRSVWLDNHVHGFCLVGEKEYCRGLGRALLSGER